MEGPTTGGSEDPRDGAMEGPTTGGGGTVAIGGGEGFTGGEVPTGGCGFTAAGDGEGPATGAVAAGKGLATGGEVPTGGGDSTAGGTAGGEDAMIPVIPGIFLHWSGHWIPKRREDMLWASDVNIVHTKSRCRRYPSLPQALVTGASEHDMKQPMVLHVSPMSCGSWLMLTFCCPRRT